MRHITIILLALLTVSIAMPSNAESIEKMYTHRSSSEGSVYFFFPQSMPSDKATKSSAKKINYDFTYVEWTDTVRMLFTVKLKEIVNDYNCQISTCDTSYNFSPALIFADIKGKEIEYRLSVAMPWDVFEEIFSSPMPFILTIETGSDKGKMDLTFRYSESKWKDYQQNMSAIIRIIRLNKKK